MVASCAPHWGALLVSMHSFQARPGLPVSAWGRESAPLLHVSGTVPGAANRMHIDRRKTEMDNLNDINRELVESLQKKVVSGEIELTAIAPLDSFLGIKFGDNADKYRCNKRQTVRSNRSFDGLGLFSFRGFECLKRIEFRSNQFGRRYSSFFEKTNVRRPVHAF